MLGFVKKDILMIKSTLKTLVIMLVIYVVMALEGMMDLSFLLPFMSVMIMISTFSYDEHNKWNSYACSLPEGRKNSVKAKYLATLLVVIAATVVITVLSMIVSLIRTKTISYEDILSTMAGVLFATILMESVMYPPIYKFGVEKARIGIFAVIFGVAVLGSLLNKIIALDAVLKTLSAFKNHIAVIFLAGMVLMLYLSYKISETIYLKKEF